MSEVGDWRQQISCSSQLAGGGYADLGFPCPRPIITAAECFDELNILSGLVGEPFEGDAF